MSQTAKITGRNLMVVGLLLAGSICHAQTELRWQFQPGQEMRQTIEQTIEMSTRSNGAPRKSKHEQTVESAWTVDSVDDEGIVSLTQRVQRIKVRIEGLGEDIVVDSTNPEAASNAPESVVAAIVAMSKASITVEMATPTGEVEDVSFSPATEKAIGMLTVSGSLIGNLSTDSLVNLIKQGTPVLPEGPIEPGSSWARKSEIPIAPRGKLVSDATLKYTGPAEEQPGMEKISMRVKNSFAPVAGQVMQITIEGGDANGAIWFDNTAGRLRRSELTQDLKMTFTLGGNIIMQEIKQTMKVELTE